METQLLTTKFHIPLPDPTLVPRPHLIQQMNAGLHSKLILLTAPAGFGKTTLISTWLHQTRQSTHSPPNLSRIVWLSLDANDNDPIRFARYLVNALQGIEAKIGEGLLSALASPGEISYENGLTSLVNELTTFQKDAILVLDDYHVIQSQSIHQILNFLLEHLPPPIHLVIASRTEPPFPLSRMRVRKQITEIHAQDMRFSLEEVTTFFSQTMKIDLALQDMELLHDRTEGWIAALQLAAISIQGEREKSHLIKNFSGNQQLIMEYLVDEVLSQLPPPLEEFLLSTSILQRMNAELCNAVLGINNSHTFLAKLYQMNLFLVSLDTHQRWSRYHHLFIDLLQGQLAHSRSEQTICALHHRAAQWHQTTGTLEEALHHYLAAGDFEQAAVLIEENIADIFSRSQVPILLNWIRKIPEEIVRQHPWIDISRAYTLALASKTEESAMLLNDLESRILPGTPQVAELRGNIAAIRAYLANLHGDVDCITEEAERAEALLPKTALLARGLLAYALSDTYFTFDDMVHTTQALTEMHRIGEKTHQLLLTVPALCQLAEVKKVQGQLHQARQYYQKAYQQMDDHNGLESRVRCAYEFGMADLLRQLDQLDAAVEHAMIGMAYREKLGGYLLVGDLTLMKIHQARGDMQGAINALHTAEQLMQTHPFQLSTIFSFRASLVIQYLQMGHIEMARHYASLCKNMTAREQIASAWLLFAENNYADALRILEQQEKLTIAGERQGHLLKILCLKAISQKALRFHAKALHTLSSAVSLARAQGYRRVFLDMGTPMYELLRTLDKQLSHNDEYITGLLDAFADQERSESTFSWSAARANSMSLSQTGQLTAREVEVLRLVAQGLTNKEIANKLIVAPSTIKQHLKHIFSKLNVHNRTQAVTRAQELELL
jgi:ATP/maltotriose-dependent transcriptional regulator MalT